MLRAEISRMPVFGAGVGSVHLEHTHKFQGQKPVCAKFDFMDALLERG
jgi:hypothetical protein